MSREQGSINWNEVIKKEARGKNDEDLGEVQEVRDMYILVQKGLLSKEKFYVPQSEVDSYDGEVLRFKVSEEDLRTKYSRDLPPSASAVPDSSTNNIEENAAKQDKSESNLVPLMEENLNVSKREVTYKEATLIREPVIETKMVEVPVTHEEIIVERRSPTEATTSRKDLGAPVTSKEEIKIPLKKEEVIVKKEPFVKEELVIKKRGITEREKITEEVKSEKLVDSRSEDNFK
jgi:uncharacterized protein (TIGR02271 family)